MTNRKTQLWSVVDVLTARMKEAAQSRSIDAVSDYSQSLDVVLQAIQMDSDWQYRAGQSLPEASKPQPAPST